MGSGAARCRRCASGYTLTGSKCVGKCLEEHLFSIISQYGFFMAPWDLQYVSDETVVSLILSDVDECSDRILACRGLDEICTNTEGSFRCDCAEGFVRRDAVCVKKQHPGGSRYLRFSFSQRFYRKSTSNKCL